MTKGLVLAGGEGTRLRPVTHIYNKHLALVYDKPMIYYPIQTLKDLGCDDILVVSGGENIGGFSELLKNGEEFDVNISYRVQQAAAGIADALKCAEGFIELNGAQQIVPVILGDNYFDGPIEMPTEETILVKAVENPNRFGVYDPNTNEIVEKPDDPTTNLAVVGLYFYKPRTILNQPSKLRPSDRGELEITDINNYILKAGAKVVGFSGFWSDMGTPDSLLEVANYEAQK